MNHVGASKPGQFAMIRLGHFQRSYGPITMLDGDPLDGRDLGTLPGGKNPWHNRWVPGGDWVMLPNLSEVTLEKTFDGNGVPQATLQLQNVVYQAIVGVLGIYHAVQRGKLSPLRGFTMLLRTAQQWTEVNEWYELLRRSSQIVVFQGYGNEFAKTFTGLIDKVDMTSNPDRMTVTSRNFAGPLLTEQRLFGNVKDPTIQPPVTFADRDSTYDVEEVSGGAKASSSDLQAAHPARNVTLKGNAYWRSRGRADDDDTEWVQIRLKKGRYEDFYIRPLYAGMEVWVSVYDKDQQEPKVTMGGHGSKPQIKAKVDGAEVRDGWYDPVSGGSWWDLSEAERDARVASGEGIVPGVENGGIPFVKHWKSMDAKGAKFKLGHKFEVGSNSIIRVHFRNLHWVGSRQWFYAGVERLIAYKRKVKKVAKKNKWILVDDVSDVVKIVLMWAGFHEWEVESFGARIDKKKPWVFHQSDFLIDLINYVKQQGDYNFFMGDPTSHDLSLGVPIFRNSRVTAPTPADMIEVKDTDLLTGISVSIDHANRPASIRVRGKEPKKGVRGQRGAKLGEDTTRRIMATYYPPWHRKENIFDPDPGHAFRDANVIRHVVHYDNLLSSKLECKVKAILIALQYSLQDHTGEVEVPGFPGIDLDELLSVVDEGTGANTRIWIAHVRSTFTSGPATKWVTQVGGSLLDVPDNLSMAVDFANALNAARAHMVPAATHPLTMKHLGGSG